MAELKQQKERWHRDAMAAASQAGWFKYLYEDRSKVKGKPDHELVVLALADGVDTMDVAQFVDVTGLSRERLYQIRRELRDIYPEIARQLQT